MLCVFKVSVTFESAEEGVSAKMQLSFSDKAGIFAKRLSVFCFADCCQTRI